MIGSCDLCMAAAPLMAFVVAMLSTHLGLSRTDAIRTMLNIHKRGGALLALPSRAEAQRVADAVTADASSQKHPLVCRAVSASKWGG